MTKKNLLCSYFIFFLITLIGRNEAFALSFQPRGYVTSKPKIQSFRSGFVNSNLIVESPHSLSATDCLDKLGSSESSGLSNEEAFRRLSIIGENKLRENPAKSVMRLIFDQFEDRLVQILLGVAVFSAILAGIEKEYHSAVEAAVILAILVLNSIIGVVQTKSAESSLDALKKLQPETTNVLRDSQWISDLPTSQLVPGDVIYLRVGDKVPADGRIIFLKTNTFSVDEACLTGESISVQKTVDRLNPDLSLSGKANMVFSGTLVTQGACCAVVTATGANTEIGIINSSVQEAKESQTKTPLAQKLDEFGNSLAKAISVICALVFLSAVPKFSNKAFRSPLVGAIHYAKIAVALGVAAIPEGLPAVITLCLSLGTKRMAKKNVIVRKLSSIETLGCTTVICTDKTGTLTTNQMTVKSLFTFRKPDSRMKPDSSESEQSDGIPLKPQVAEMRERRVAGVSYEPIGEIECVDEHTLRSPTVQILSVISTLCNEARLEFRDGHVMPVGEATEAALKVFAEKLGVSGLAANDKSTGQFLNEVSEHWAKKFSVLSMQEFSRDRKSMSVLVRPSVHSLPSSASRVQNMLLVKGAAELLLDRCTKIMLEDGSIVPISPDIRLALSQEMMKIARRPLRSLALAYKYGDSLGELNRLKDAESASNCKLLKDSANYALMETDLTLVGLVGIKDPARPEAGEAILRCRDAGIRVMMITGDSKETASAIARDVNILSNDREIEGSAFTSREFFALPEEQQLQQLRTGNKVFCRTEPRDKQRLISMLERLGEIPAMTGDGVNDAPALQQAAIGIAMGQTGTEVAKSAADMILTDDNFSSIVNAVEEGRNIYANMQSFIFFLLSCNLGEIITIFLSSCLGIPEPLTPLHLLWVNLITDGAPATALAFNPSDPQVMKKRPRRKEEQLFTKALLWRYVLTGSYVAAATIGSFVWWFADKAVTFSQLRSWDRCADWSVFAHSADAPEWTRQPCEIFVGKHLQRAQSVALSVLVTLEMLKALSSVSSESSLLQLPPWRNPWLVASVLLPSLLHLAIMYVPAASRVFGLSPLSAREWRAVLLVSLPVLLLEELLKIFVRRKRAREEAQNRAVDEPSPSPSRPL